MLSCREDEILPDCFVKVLFEMSLGLSRSQIRNKQEPVQRNYVLIHKDTALQLHFPSCKGDAYPLLAYYNKFCLLFNSFVLAFYFLFFFFLSDV